MDKSSKGLLIVLIGGTGFPIIFQLLEHSVAWSFGLKMLAAWLITAGITLVAYLLLYGHFPRWGD